MSKAPSLATYNKKRNFQRTPEPAGKRDKRAKQGLQFVIQKHAARRLHYDFRLEMGGVLVSWAIPKGPSLDPKDKRLAVRTEDHPLSYAEFEGIIPARQYGAGSVMLWDRGAWEPVSADDPLAALARGRLRFRLRGAKLQGEWTLARMRGKQEEQRENWLLIKAEDEAADMPLDFLAATDYSVASGRSFDMIVSADASDRDATRQNAQPRQAELAKSYAGVQLATLVEAPPQGADWLHEIKYDGYRILALVTADGAQIRTRNHHNWTHKMPAIAKALTALTQSSLPGGAFVIDGEAVMINEAGLSDFKALQNALGDSGAPMRAYFFDLLYWQGQDQRRQPLAQRRQALERLFSELGLGAQGNTLQLSQAIRGDAEQVVAQACRLGLEGIISKRLDAPYRSGRQASWQKSKCGQRQEFVIGGFIPASDNARAIGALHLGYYREEKLRYAGKVGTGFDRGSAVQLYDLLSARRQKKPPFAAGLQGSHSTSRWVRPETTCEVKFASWTASGKIRHASYQGLRADKAPTEITREQPARASPKAAKKTKAAKKIKTARTQALARFDMKAKSQPRSLQVAGVNISNSQRVIFPEAGVTKGELAEFYAVLAELIMPQICERPISVVRCPGGLSKQCFYQRSKGEGMPDHIHRIDLSHKDKQHEYIYIKDLRGLIELVQMGGIEVHPWGARIDQIERPDKIIFDLDPAPDVPFEAVKLAARDLKRRFDELDLASFLKTTGGKGLHVVIPIERRHAWETIKDFSRAVAKRMVADVPQAYTATLSKQKRTGKILIDYFRNDYASTAVMDYCVRSRPGAPVAVPLAWAELERLSAPNQFSLSDALARKVKGLKLLEQYQGVRQSLTKEKLAHYWRP